MEIPHGLLAVPDVKPGEHIGVVYEYPEDRLKVLAPFVRAGLKRGERVWLALEMAPEQISERLAAEGMDVEACLALGQLVLLPVSPSGHNQAGIGTWLQRETLRALDEGYSGLRVVLEDEAFEAGFTGEPLSELNGILSNYPCAVLCLYRRIRLDADQLWKLLRSHSALAATNDVDATGDFPEPENESGCPPRWYEELTHPGPDLFVMLDQDLQCVYWDQTTAAVTGIPAEQALGRPFNALFPKFKNTPAEQIFRQVLDQGNPQSFEFEYARADCTYFFEVSVYPIGRGISVFANEITARKQAEAAQQERETYHVGLFENHFEPMLLIDPGTGRIVDANPAACSFYGYDRTTLKTLKITDINMLPPETVFQKMGQARQHEQSQFEFRHRLADGRIREVEVHSGPIWRYGRELLYSIIHDVTERRRAEQLLRESQERFSRLVETVPGGIIFATPDGRLQFMNAAAERILGITIEDAVHLSYEDLCARITTIDGDPLPEEALTFRRVVAQNQAIYGFKCAVRRWDDEAIAYLSVNSAPLYGPQGEIQGVVSSLTDITPLLRAEEAQRRLLEQVEQERRHAEALAAEARKQAEKWDTVFKALTDSVVIMDAQGQPVSANPATLRIFGMDPTLHNLEGRTKRIQVRRPDGRIVTHWDGFPAVRALQGETVIGGQYHITNAKGRDLAVLVSAAPIYEGEHIAGAVVIWHDMTEREQLFQQAERERQRSEQLVAEAQHEAERLKTIFSALTDLVILVDAEGKIVGVNPAAVRFFEQDPTRSGREALSRKTRVRYPDGRPLKLDEFSSSRALRGEVVQSTRFIVRGPGGQDRTVEVSAAPIREGEQITGAVSIWRDVTEREQLVLQVEQERRRAEGQALEARQQAHWLEAVIHAMSDVVLIFDAEGRIVRANPAAHQLLGVDLTRIDRTGLIQRIQIRQPDDRPLRPDELPSARALNGEVVQRERYRLTDAEGNDLFLTVSASPVYDAGRIIGAVVVWRDVTEHEQLVQEIEAERRKMQLEAEQLNTIFSAMTDVVIVMDEKGKMIAANPAAVRFFGGDPTRFDRETLGKRVRVSHLDGRPARIEEYPASRSLKTGELVLNEPYRINNAEGQPLILSFSAIPLRKGERIIGAVSVWHDITEREQLLQRLEYEHQAARQQADKWNAVFNSMTDAVLLYDATGRLISANPEASRLYGLENLPAYGRERMIRDSQMRYSDGRRVDRIEEVPSSRALRGETATNERFIFTNAQGKETTVLISASPLWEEGQVIGAVAVWHDVTEREQLLQQVEQNRRLLQTLIDTVPIGIVAVDAEGKLLLRNPVSEEILGSAIYKTARQYMGDYTLHRLDGTLIPGAEGPFARALFRGETVSGEELRVRRYDGTEVIIECAANLIRDEKGGIQGAIGTLQDITARKQVEAERERLMADLDAERCRLRTILDTLPVGVFIADANGTRLESNAMLARIWGGELPVTESQEEYGVYKGWRAETGEPVAAEEWTLARALRGETTVGEVFDVERFDGTRGTHLNSAAPIRDPAGRIMGAVAVIQDITRQRRLELEAVEQRRRFEALARELETILATIDVGVIVTDCDHRVVRINRLSAERFHLPPEAILGQRLSDLSGREDLDASRQQVLESGKPIRWKAMGFGDEFWDVVFAPICNSDGVTEQVLITYADVTGHVRARQEVELERTRWLTTLTTLPLPVIFVDSEGVVQMVNRAAQEFWQRPLIGEHWPAVLQKWDYLVPETGSMIPLEARPVMRALRGETVRDCEIRLVQPDGRQMPALLHAAPVVLEGQVVGAVQVAQDLTQLKEADRIKDQFLAIVSHDLRSPLATIQGWAIMAQQSNDDPEVIRKALDLILKGVQTQQRLINDLLDSAALTIGALRVSPEVQELQPIVELVCQGAQANGAERGITLDWALAPEPLLAAVDGVRLQQILGNLIANAYKFTPKGGRVEVRLMREGEQAVLTVRDTGRGIPADHLPHVFERFYSPAGSQQPTSRSLGLGLAIVKAMVELHGGTVHAWSEGPQKGSCFTVRLPLAELPDDSKSPFSGEG